MKIAVVAAGFATGAGGLARHVDRLARGLAERGADVDVLWPRWLHRKELPTEPDAVVLHRFSEQTEPRRSMVETPLWKALRFAIDTHDVVDVHLAKVPFSLTVARARFRRMVLTPHVPLQRFSTWPYSWAIRNLVECSDSILCLSAAERAVLRRTFPRAVHRTEVLPAGVDAAAIAAAEPYALPGKVLVSVGGLDRHRRVDRVIAAIASLDPTFRLVVLGDGPERHRLRAYAADLRVDARVSLAGPMDDAILYRCLRTARVVVSLAEQESSGVHIMEALAAGVPVVGSDIPVHREVTEQIADGTVIFVPPTGSPLEVADAIAEAADLAEREPSSASPAPPMPSWDDVVDHAWSVYRRLVSPIPSLDRAREIGGVVALSERTRSRAQGGPA